MKGLIHTLLFGFSIIRAKTYLVNWKFIKKFFNPKSGFSSYTLIFHRDNMELMYTRQSKNVHNFIVMDLKTGFTAFNFYAEGCNLKSLSKLKRLYKLHEKLIGEGYKVVSYKKYQKKTDVVKINTDAETIVGVRYIAKTSWYRDTI